MPGGSSTEAELLTTPGAEGVTVAWAVKTTAPKMGRLTVVLMLPLPEVAAAEPPSTPAAVQETFWSEAGKISVTGAFRTRPGPRFLTIIWYVMAWPLVT